MKPYTPADLTPGTLTPDASPARELNPLPDVDARANLLHMELFHHFLQVTFRTLSFSDLWTEVIQLSFHVSLTQPTTFSHVDGPEHNKKPRTYS